MKKKKESVIQEKEDAKDEVSEIKKEAKKAKAK
jgi:hypothetical protein